jgi:hypothetical protein
MSALHGSDRRRSEAELNLDQLSPVDAIVRLIEFTFDYDEAHPDFIRLVMAENMNHGEYVAQSDTIRQRNRGVIAMLRQILERGQREGVFRKGIDPVDIHMLISSFCFFRVSNRSTILQRAVRPTVVPQMLQVAWRRCPATSSRRH